MWGCTKVPTRALLPSRVVENLVSSRREIAELSSSCKVECAQANELLSTLPDSLAYRFVQRPGVAGDGRGGGGPWGKMRVRENEVGGERKVPWARGG